MTDRKEPLLSDNLFLDYIIKKDDCQVYKGEDDEKTIEELTADETLSKFEKKLSQRTEYEGKIIKRLSLTQKAAWISCCDQVWVRQDGTVSSLKRCKNRLCGLCNWRTAQRHFIEVKSMVGEIEKAHAEKPPVWLFLTLTVKNCCPEKLSDTIDEMMKAVNRMQSNRAWKTRVKGYIRHMEVTVGQDKKSFHPHLHYILEMPNAYFKDKKIFLSWEQWRLMWCKAMDIDYIEENQCKVEYIKRTDIEKAIAEVSKYAVKLTKDLAEQSDIIIGKLIAGLKNRRLHAYGGELKEEYKKTAQKEKHGYNPFDEIPEGKPYVRDESGFYVYAKELEKLKHKSISVRKDTGEIIAQKQIYAASDRAAFRDAFQKAYRRNRDLHIAAYGNNSSQKRG